MLLKSRTLLSQLRQGFCLGAVAEWRQDEAAAVREYEQAIAMRAYRAIYHLRLGELLARQGKKDRARQALEWAAKVDAEGRVAEEAGRLLQEARFETAATLDEAAEKAVAAARAAGGAA